jgi:hypothetical protein
MGRWGRRRVWSLHCSRTRLSRRCCPTCWLLTRAMGSSGSPMWCSEKSFCWCCCWTQ